MRAAPRASWTSMGLPDSVEQRRVRYPPGSSWGQVGCRSRGIEGVVVHDQIQHRVQVDAVGVVGDGGHTDRPPRISPPLTRRTRQVIDSGGVAVFGPGFLPVGFGLSPGERLMQIGGERSLGGAGLAHGAPAAVELLGHPEIPPVMSFAGPVGGTVLVGVVPPGPHQHPKVRERRGLRVFEEQCLGGRHEMTDPRVGIGAGQFLHLGRPDLTRLIGRGHRGQVAQHPDRLPAAVGFEPRQLTDMTDQGFGGQVPVGSVGPPPIHPIQHPGLDRSQAAAGPNQRRHRPQQVRIGGRIQIQLVQVVEHPMQPAGQVRQGFGLLLVTNRRHTPIVAEGYDSPPGHPDQSRTMPHHPHHPHQQAREPPTRALAWVHRARRPSRVAG